MRIMNIFKFPLFFCSIKIMMFPAPEVVASVCACNSDDADNAQAWKRRRMKNFASKNWPRLPIDNASAPDPSEESFGTTTIAVALQVLRLLPFQVQFVRLPAPILMRIRHHRVRAFRNSVAISMASVLFGDFASAAEWTAFQAPVGRALSLFPYVTWSCTGHPPILSMSWFDSLPNSAVLCCIAAPVSCF